MEFILGSTLIFGIETAFPDQLFPMPSGDNPTPYINHSAIEQQDYFGAQNTFSLPPVDSRSAPVGSKTGTPSRSNSILRKPVPSRRHQNGSTDTILHYSKVHESMLNKLSPPSNVNSRPLSKQGNHAEDSSHPLGVLPIPTPPPQQSQHFLGKIVRLAEAGGPRIRGAIAISYPLVSMSQVLTRPRLFQSLKECSC
jgi:hypothetical protein